MATVAQLGQRLHPGVVTNFGAIGDGITDDTAAIQAAITWVEANLDKTREVFFPSGSYVVSGITATTACLRGEAPTRALLGVVPVAGARLIHKVGSTTPLITLAGGLSTGYGWETVEHLSLQGRQKANVTATKRSIVSASNRHNFVVAVGDLPTAAADVSTFPHYGLCMFYDANGHRLGSGIVQTVNGGTGQVTLRTGTDNYTGITGSSNLLTSTEKVAFAPVATWVGDGITFTNYSDSTMISPPAILVQGRTKVIDWVDIRDFHCSIVLQDTVTRIEHLWSHNHGMAAVAMRALGSGADVWADKWFLQGRGYEGFGESARAIGVIDANGHWSLCGMWGLPSAAHFGEVCMEAHTHHIIDKGATGINFDYLLLDGSWKESVVTWGGVWNVGTSTPAVNINQLHVRGLYSSYSQLTSPTYPSGERAVFGIVATDAHRKFDIGAVNVNRFDSGSPAGFDYASLAKFAGVAFNGRHEVNARSIPFQGALTTKATAQGFSSRPGMYACPPVAQPTAQATAANVGRIVRFEPLEDMTVDTIAFAVTVAASVDDPVDVGILSASGARIVSSGATTGKLNSLGRKTATFTPTILRGGTVYYLAISVGTVGGTAATLMGVTMAAAAAGQLFGATLGTTEIDTANSAHPIPSQWTLGSVSSVGWLGAVLKVAGT